jgi:hypothetical protein
VFIFLLAQSAEQIGKQKKFTAYDNQANHILRIAISLKQFIHHFSKLQILKNPPFSPTQND